MSGKLRFHLLILLDRSGLLRGMAFEPEEDGLHDEEEARTGGDRRQLRQVDVLVSQGRRVAEAICLIALTKVITYR